VRIGFIKAVLKPPQTLARQPNVPNSAKCLDCGAFTAAFAHQNVFITASIPSSVTAPHAPTTNRQQISPARRVCNGARGSAFHVSKTTQIPMGFL